MNTTPATDTDGAAGTAAVDTVIIGAGQSGLALGYYLATHDGQRFHVTAGTQRWTASNVVLATGACLLPRTPRFAADLPADVVQLHSHYYRNPAQLTPGPVLVVGVGNSGAEIALETSRTHETWLAGSPSGQIPFRHGRIAARYFLPLVRFAGMHVLNTHTPVGRRALQKSRPKLRR